MLDGIYFDSVYYRGLGTVPERDKYSFVVMLSGEDYHGEHAGHFPDFSA